MKICTFLTVFLSVIISTNAYSDTKCQGYAELDELIHCSDARALQIPNVPQSDAGTLSNKLYYMTLDLGMYMQNIFLANTYHPRLEVMEVVLLSDDSKAVDNKISAIEDYLKTKLNVTQTFAPSAPHFYVSQQGLVWDNADGTFKNKQFFGNEVGVLNRAGIKAYIDTMGEFRNKLEAKGANWKVLLTPLSAHATLDWAVYDSCTKETCKAAFQHFVGWSNYPELIGPNESLSMISGLYSGRQP